MTVAVPPPDVVRGSIRGLAETFAARAAGHDRTGALPHGDVAALHGVGLLALTVSRRRGGARAAEVVGTVGAVQRATKLCGDAGLSRDNPLERHLRDVPCARIPRPQGDAVRAGAGRAAPGL